MQATTILQLLTSAIISAKNAGDARKNEVLQQRHGKRKVQLNLFQG